MIFSLFPEKRFLTAAFYQVPRDLDDAPPPFLLGFCTIALRLKIACDRRIHFIYMNHFPTNLGVSARVSARMSASMSASERASEANSAEQAD